ncbi:hypothetical protein [Magnetospirillum molischianum]|uniref:Uncharacterized protein n=1 Tax=Magnetospirillum molischianum DSM 120 TaxID=1150626 RepID=H8FUX6_MAGML|nr:hypothetical protein [Magnetospirillum molischianum]CCG42164.1 conserved hypothetical protein [Magnetospirillum molischianum DSM 120]
MSESGLISTDLVRRVTSDALALYCGDGRRYSRDLLASATGQDVRTVKAHVLGECAPSSPALLTYCRILPGAFARHILAMAGITGLRKDDYVIAPGSALAEMAEGVAVLAEALADGRIDHTERPRLLRELREAVAAQESLIAQLESADAALRTGRAK